MSAWRREDAKGMCGSYHSHWLKKEMETMTPIAKTYKCSMVATQPVHGEVSAALILGFGSPRPGLPATPHPGNVKQEALSSEPGTHIKTLLSPVTSEGCFPAAQ